MKLLTFRSETAYWVGIKTERGIIPTNIAATQLYHNGTVAIAELAQLAESGAAALAESELEFGPVVPNPGKILCVGLNYRRHAAEFGKPEPAYPILFSKFNNALAAHGEDVPISAEWEHVDYEAELAVIIGKRAWRVTEDHALGHVLGYCCANDITERHFQRRTDQWLLGKTMDKFLPIGPYLVTADEVPYPQNLTIRGWLNDDLRQDSSTSDMIFSISHIIAYASHFFPLEPGDILLTGTPEGVIIGREEKTYLKPGDRYVIEIEGLGQLSNRIVAL